MFVMKRCGMLNVCLFIRMQNNFNNGRFECKTMTLVHFDLSVGTFSLFCSLEDML